jgi:hypothetical protein
MKHIKLATCISLYEDVFDADNAEQFISLLNENTKDEWNELSWNNSGTGSGAVSSYRTSLSCSLIPIMKPYPETELSSFFDKNIRKQVEEVVEDYRREHMLPNGIFEPYSVLKYLPEAEYHAHYDHFRDNSRVFSMVTTLGQPVSGGELEFPNFEVTVTPKTGSVILFPANFPYLHVAHPVNEGIKYSMVTWYQ